MLYSSCVGVLTHLQCSGWTRPGNGSRFTPLLTLIQQSKSMAHVVLPADLSFFSTLAACGSLSAAARELGVTTPAVSKHLAQMEARVGVPLVTRTTRRMSLTPDGELYLAHSRRILGEIDDLAQLLGTAKVTPKGLLRVNATL